MAYYTGATLGVKLTINDPSDLTVPVDPTTVSVTIEAPDGAVTAQSTTRVDTGEYTFTFTANQAGMWRWVVTTTGAYAGVQPGVVNVQSLPSGL